MLRRFAQPRAQGGQSLIEMVLAIGVVAIIAAGIGTLVVVTQRTQETGRRRDQAAGLSTEAFAAIRAISESDDATSQGYNTLYCPPTGNCDSPGTKGTCSDSSCHYRTVVSNGKWILESGEETIPISNVTYTRYLTVENVCRDASTDDVVGPTDGGGSSETCAESGGSHDPATVRVTVTVRADFMNDLSVTQFVTRWRNESSGQSDWSGGPE